MYRKISDFKPTTNTNVIDAYEKEMQRCDLLCKTHHEHTHTHHLLEKSRLELQQTAASHLATYLAVVAEYGELVAVRVLREKRKLA